MALPQLRIIVSVRETLPSVALITLRDNTVVSIENYCLANRVGNSAHQRFLIYFSFFGLCSRLC